MVIPASSSWPNEPVGVGVTAGNPRIPAERCEGVATCTATCFYESYRGLTHPAVITVLPP